MEDLTDLLVKAVRINPMVGVVLAAVVWFSVIKPWFFPDEPEPPDPQSNAESTPGKSALERKDYGIQLFESGRAADGLLELKEVVKDQPENVELRRTYASLLRRAKQPDRAIYQYRVVLRFQPRDSMARMGLAHAFADKDERQKAVELCEEIMAEQAGAELVAQATELHAKLRSVPG